MAMMPAASIQKPTTTWTNEPTRGKKGEKEEDPRGLGEA